MKDFINFLLRKTYLESDSLFNDEDILDLALKATHKDVLYHFNNTLLNNTIHKIQSNQNELAIFLYRCGNIIYQHNNHSKSLDIIHWLMKELCACEIYYSNFIDEGFYITHGVGTVIGSRNTIGKGFKIYQNCTIGHKMQAGEGNTIGNNVICYAGAKILGGNKIGNNVIIGANTIVTKDIPSDSLVFGNPMTLKTHKT